MLPAPSAIAVAFSDGFFSGDFVWHFAVTMYEILAGFVLGATCGLLLGFVVALVPLAERILYPYIVAFQTVPKVAIAPIIVIWFGYGVTSKIVITATIAFFPLLANTIVGLRAAPHDQIEMLVSYTASRWQVFTMVRLKQALPYIFVGLDVAIVLSVIGAIVGEFVGVQGGAWLPDPAKKLQSRHGRHVRDPDHPLCDRRRACTPLSAFCSAASCSGWTRRASAWSAHDSTHNNNPHHTRRPPCLKPFAPQAPMRCRSSTLRL